METTANTVLAARFQRQIIGAFRAERALSGPSARRLRELGLRDTQVLQELITLAVIRKAGPERYFLDEEAWAARGHPSLWHLALIVAGVVLVVGLGAAFLISR
jgi:hypothetical protein